MNEKNIDHYVASHPDVGGQILPGVDGYRAFVFRKALLSELSGVHFSLPEDYEPIERQPDDQQSLQSSLDSEEHLTERQRVLPEVKGPRILELGSGTGSLIKLLALHDPELELLVGVELSPHFHQVASNRLPDVAKASCGKTQLYMVRADITKMELKFQYFNTIILASILHEIKSYFSSQKVESLLREAQLGLEVGGQLVICDGFRRPDAMAKMTLESPELVSTFKSYCAKLQKKFTFRQNGNTVILPTTDAIEFATKIQFSGWEGELREDYYPYTLEEYEAMLKKADLEIEKVQTFPEEGVLPKGISIVDEKTGQDEGQSNNNIMIVAVKRKSITEWKE